MNKFLPLIFVSSLVASTAQAQSLATSKDSLSYALGRDIGSSLKNAGFDIDIQVLSEAISSSLAQQEGVFGDEQNSQIIQGAVKKLMDERNAVLRQPGEDFLAKNKTNPNIKITAEGVQYEVLVQGEGIQATVEDEVVVHYKGSLIDGKQFDSSYDRGEPVNLDLDRVIEGWKIGIPLMKTGSKYKFYIPYHLGYGERGAGEIPAFSTLIFEVELLEIKAKNAV
ncbi:FKBP-type peptidyl-prolyl cis-trans isomerase [Sphingobacterium alkalisoli]|uniref:Peptidyl-prolyl cis-trans isomerase n=1 Tax=Sphingobacterium alkalisoli TaxID=1874115 RepID=A0A4U0GWT3_9SPHI|nr:FKBP-type peptidyl-prolyl cis-trans isomerase [Sphingobacterium alkalisoli]TJY63595.1 FKBP-type peptidyl-prolyl cis-trans isomerase [Sphingobacterium alkalisoli]GGH27056.1 peptidyl-prolyl cis-trans isomerase [Sphingobacterium alkalisoli]